MRTIRNSFGSLAIIGGLIASLNFVHGQTTAKAVQAVSAEDTAVMLQAMEATTPVAAESVPRCGTFYSALMPMGPPLPANINNVPAWNLGDGAWLLDDLDQPQAQKQTMAGNMKAMDAPAPGGSGDGGTNSYTANASSFVLPDYGTNLWIAQVGVSSGSLVGIVSNSQPDISYEIQSLNQAQPGAGWNSEGFILGSELTNWTPMNVAQGNRTNLVVRIRSWIDSDNVGIPDWWQLQFFGCVGINPYAVSPSGDGFTIWQKYQNGLNPTNFETPPAPGNFVAVLSTNGTNALLSWSPAQGSVMNYGIFRDVYDFYTDDLTFSNIATVNSSTNSYKDVGPIDNSSGEYYYSYDLTANYPGGNTSQYAYSSLYDTAPPPATPPAPVYNISVSATLVRNATGRWQLIFSGLPSNAQTIRLYWNSTTQDISANILTNGIYQIPDTEVVNYLGDTVSVQGIGANGEPGQVVQVGILPNDAPYFVDGRRHMKQNLTFLIRGASLSEPFFSLIFGYQQFAFDDWLMFGDPFWGNFNLSSKNFEEFSFLHHNDFWLLYPYAALDDLWPFTANYDLANYFVDTTRTNPLPFGSTNFIFQPNFTTNIPAQPILSHADPYWILQPSFYPGYTTTNWAVSVNGAQTVASLANGSQNLFGLPYQTGCDVDMKWRNYPYTVDCAYQALVPGDSVTANSNYFIGDYASWCPAPTLIFNNYYFAPLINPNANPMNLPGVGQQPLPLPIDDTFNVTNQTPSLIIGAVGQPMIIAGWAKYAIQNGSTPTGKYAYLGQYFSTNVFLLDANGKATTNTAGILSPYGEFFPTQAGRAQLVTMPDIDTGKQGTNIVQIISLNVDANHDGTIDLSYFGQDQTSPSKPYVFWCNNNFDRWHTVDGTDHEQDDMPPQSAPDCNYMVGGTRVIPCTRDLEDFSRLWISGVTTNLLAALPAGSTVTLNWGDIGNPNPNNPTIDLFQAADTDGGIGYLTNNTIATLQTNNNQCWYLGPLAPGGSLQLNTIQFNNYWAGNHFIWCGVSNGSGQLSLTFADASGRVLGQASVYIQIVDIKQMYERWTVGDNSTQPPATTAYLAGDLPSDMTQSFQYTTLATTNTPYILFVHGWNLPLWEKDRYAETAFKRLYWQGYQGRFGEFRWPTFSGFPFGEFTPQAFDLRNFDNSEYNAWLSGASLLNKLNDLNTQYPGNVYLMAHSLGNVVAGEALRLAGSSQIVNTYIAMQGAVAAHCYDLTTANRSGTFSTPDDYANYWTNSACYFNGSAGAGTYVNFFNTNDYALHSATFSWEYDQSHKPDNSITGYPGYHYNVSSLHTNGFYAQLGAGTNAYQNFNFPGDTYTIFAYCDQARSYALGAQTDVDGVFNGNQIDLTLDPINFSVAHKYHSGEFRSDNAQRWQFWDQVLFQMSLKKKL